MKTPATFLVLATAVSPAWCGEAPTIDRLVACAEVADSPERLVCFDREIAPFAKARISPIPAPVAPAAASLGQEQLGIKARPAAKEEKQLLHARIASLRQAGPGTYVISLDNGQAWRHENEHLGSYLREGEAITIRKATLGTYRLIRDDGDAKNWIRVTRVR